MYAPGIKRTFDMQRLNTGRWSYAESYIKRTFAFSGSQQECLPLFLPGYRDYS
jgi:hypothetical protein